MSRKEKLGSFAVVIALLICVVLDLFQYERGFFYHKNGQDRIVEGTLVNTTRSVYEGKTRNYLSVVRYKDKNSWKVSEVPRGIGDQVDQKIKLIITPDGKCMREGWIWGRHSYKFWVCVVGLGLLVFGVITILVKKIIHMERKRS